MPPRMPCSTGRERCTRTGSLGISTPRVKQEACEVPGRHNREIIHRSRQIADV